MSRLLRLVRVASASKSGSKALSKRWKVFLGAGSGSITAVGLGFGIYKQTRPSLLQPVHADSPTPNTSATETVLGVSGGRRRRRFMEFASCEYESEPYMTPQDFLESLSFSEPSPRIGRRKLSQKEVSDFLKKVPSISKNSCMFFRDLLRDGLLSYPEYLFLTTLLTKAKRQFEIAFLMYDRDGNGTIDKNEFLIIERVVSKQGESKKGSESNTSLLVHLFGAKGDQVLDFESFSKFMDNLQHEVLDIEFHEASHGLPVISETTFARLLLRDSNLDESEVQEYLERLKQRNQANEGITFPQFLDFARFLNELEDFSVAVKMFTLAGKPITQDEFQRAVKSSLGKALDSKLVQVVFQIFDVDGDGKLSYEEFIDVMKDRKNRGFKSRDAPKGWEGFKHCMQQKMMK